ncbi:hypothetical protein IWW37_003743 [Coemansia sp. RSA 2050]|nr:hypothetical protein IWW37_003743 [Coemansia sp. RSA 2050]
MTTSDKVPPNSDKKPFSSWIPHVSLVRLDGWPTEFPDDLEEYRQGVLDKEWASDIDKHRAEIAPWVWHHRGDADVLQSLALSNDTLVAEQARREMAARKIIPNYEPRANASFVVLIRNREMKEFRATMRQLEDRFNGKYHYPYLFLNDEPFSEEFMLMVAASTTSNVTFALIPRDHWSLPEFVDEGRALAAREQMAANNVIYGGSLSYRHMCRFNSGFFYKHPLLRSVDWYWRVEPGVDFYCDLDYDPFRYMEDHGKLYSFVIALKELELTIPSLWDHTLEYMAVNNITSDLMSYFVTEEGGYNLCHFWSNFEIASLNWLRSPAYESYFGMLDRAGGFFMERWGDAPVHSLAAGMLLNYEQVHFFDDIGYKHADFVHCSESVKCRCPLVFDNFDSSPGSCLPRWKSFKPGLWTERDSREARRLVRERKRFRVTHEGAHVAERRRWYDLLAVE